MPPATAAALARLHQRWAALSVRERQLVQAAAAALLLLVLWYGMVQPVWQTWRTAPAQLATTEAQWLRMQAQASEAKELKSQSAISPAQARQALQAASERLGEHAKLQIQGERATLTLTNAPAQQWRTWLNEARQGARARPVEAQLSRNEQGLLSGQVVLQLPSSPS